MIIEKINGIKDKKKCAFYAKIENLVIQQTANNNDFFSLFLYDDTGYIAAKKWNVSEWEKKIYRIGQVVYLQGYGNEYNEKLQFIIEEMRLIDENDLLDINIFYKSAPLSVNDLRKEINIYIEKIKNVSLRKITEYLFYKYENEYLTYPAATKNHHAYISGLAYHVVTMLNLAAVIGEIYPLLNMDLLYSGIILHDLGKVIELSDGLAPEYTVKGKLLGHINITFELIRQSADYLCIGEEETTLLQHLILSHHGLLEYGSPKRPMIIEAEALHLIDLMDSRFDMIISKLDNTADNDFTKRIYSLDNRCFYKHKIKN